MVQMDFGGLWVTLSGVPTMSGGPMYALKNGLGLHWLGWIFALCGAIAALGIGNMVQANSIALVFRSELGIPVWITAIALALLTWLVIIGGIKRIATVAEFLVPIMCIVYFLGGIVVIIAKSAQIPAASSSRDRKTMKVRSRTAG